MQTEIIVAIIAFIGTLAGSYFANSKTTAVMQEQIKSLNDAIWKKVHPEGENGEMSLFN